ncbi:MAG: ATP-binding protein [Gammaproteobacteria bacterium]|nr:ATP-binding protein [Gammaproteobacteria bacterium]
MNNLSFPKPIPVEPPSLEVLLGDVDRAEVGREAFFRGRDHEYGVFQNAVSLLKADRIGGGTMVFQGAPGAGKSALMAECMEAVRLHSTPEDPWVAISIGPAALMSAEGVVMIMIEEANRERERLLERFPRQNSKKLEKLWDTGKKLLSDLAKRGYTVSAGGLDVTVHGKPTNAHYQEDVLAERVFREVAPLFKDIHTVIFVDEAQNIPVSESTKAVMDCLHRDTKGIPMIAAFFGLSDTKGALRQCGLSRFARGRVITLDTLSHEEASSAIQGIFNAYDLDVPASIQAVWVDELARLSQGWPQHIKCVSVAAAGFIRDHEGVIEETMLAEILKHGQELKEEYYSFRLEACSEDTVVYEQIALAASEVPNGVLSRTYLRKMTASFLKDSKTTFDDFLTNALHAGVLMEINRPPKHYRIPIPSFGDFLRKMSEGTIGYAI